MNRTVNNQNGSTLIEALVAIVVLTIGIFAAMTMQVRAIDSSSAAMNRTNATNIAIALLETLKALDFDDANLTETTAAPGDLVQGDGNDLSFTAATFPEMAAIIQQPAGAVAGTIVDNPGVSYQLFWDVQDNTMAAGGVLHKIIRVHLSWNSVIGPQNLEMTTVKYNNISL